MLTQVLNMKAKLMDINTKLLLLMVTMLFGLAQIVHSQELKTVKPNYTPLVNTKWNMFGPIRLTIQDFAVTDKYADTVSGKIEGGFLELANLNYGIGFYQNFSSKLALSAEFMFGYGYLSKKTSNKDDVQKIWTQTIRADLYYHFYKENLPLQPYLFTSIYGTYHMGNIYVSLPIGFGTRYFLMNNKAMFTAQVGYGIGLTNGVRNSVIYSTGVYFKLKK